jgi:tetratricopeptide (TPR) repeat protein
MRQLLLTVFTFFFLIQANSQQNFAVVDTLKKNLAKAQKPEDKMYFMGTIAQILMNTDMAEADRYGTLLTQEAEMSRDRKLMVKALMINGMRYSFFPTNKELLQKSLDYYNKALDLAKQNKLDKETAEALLSLSSVYTSIPDINKSLNYTTQAFAISSNLKDDSLQVANYYSYGYVYQLKKDRILALRNYLNALRIAEETKNKAQKHVLLRICYAVLSNFYADIKSYDKAIDYTKLSADELPLTSLPNKEYLSVVDLYTLGRLYMNKKDFDMSVFYFEKSIKAADSLKYYPLKMPGYTGLLNQYLRADQPQKALDFLNSRSDLKQFLANFRSSQMIDHAYAIIYTGLKQYDSAKYYYEKATPAFEATSTPSTKMNFYAEYGHFYKTFGNTEKSIEYFTKAMTLADETGELDWQRRITKELDSAYAKAGDYKQSYYYSSLHHQYKDSLQKLSEEKDILQMELDDEQQRQARLERERLEAQRRKHNIQYMGITIGIATVFLLLVLMGIFQVSVSTIKIIGFFAFIFFFEFIILIADTQIHHWTHGEPLPILGIKVLLIAMLLPLHHWLEHKVINYLTSKRLIIPVRTGFWKNILAKRKSEAN